MDNIACLICLANRFQKKEKVFSPANMNTGSNRIVIDIEKAERQYVFDIAVQLISAFFAVSGKGWCVCPLPGRFRLIYALNP
jgi:hypothetical protein